MKYAVAFFLIAAALVYLAFHHGGWALLLLWPAVSFLIVSFAYAILGPRVLGKATDGRFTWWSHLPLLPFRTFAHGTWWVQKSLSREPVCAEVAPGVWVGRRAADHELPPGDLAVIDLTSEFTDPPAVRAGRTYHCVPTLDASAPAEAMTRAVLDQLAAASTPVYIHCAQGHGRSATFAAALLIRRGLARDVDDAVNQLIAKRPGVRLNRCQRELVQKLTRPLPG